MSSTRLSLNEIKNLAGRLYDGKVALLRSDITKLEIHAIVNAANKSLMGGGGVDGAIHAAAGTDLVKECEKLGGCDTGEAKITNGYKLPCKKVIHTVGPIGENPEKLKNCYINSLDLLLKHKLRTIAFPCISTGIYGYPNEAAAHVALGTTRKWLKMNGGNVDLIIFCLFMPIDVKIYNELAKKYFPDSEFTFQAVKSKEGKEDTEKSTGTETSDQAQANLGSSTGLAVQEIGPVVDAVADTEVEKQNYQSQDKADECSNAPTGKHALTQEENLERSMFDPKLTPLKVNFERLEKELISKHILKDTEPWVCSDGSFPELARVGGLDISYHINKSDVACVSFIILSLPGLEVIYEDTTVEKVDIPYIPGYLAYRESPLYKKKVQKVLRTDIKPQIILLDGNGVLHPRRFGLACALGVECDVATIGIAKNLFQMRDEGVERDSHHAAMISDLKTEGSFDICTSSGEVLGKAVRTSDSSRKPVYVSIGHRCSLETATSIAKRCSKYRLPEPIRQADVRSREMLRIKFKDDYASYHEAKHSTISISTNHNAP